MISFRQFAYAAALCASFLLPAAASAQNQNPVSDTQTTGAWTVRCYRVPRAPCEMMELVYDSEHRGPVASVSIAYFPKNNVFVGNFVMPLGVSFDQGMSLQVGNFNQTHIKFRLCQRNGCYMTSALPPSLIEAMRSQGSTKGQISTTFVDGRPIVGQIDFDGFSEGMDLLKKWSSEKAGADEKSPAPKK